MQCSYQVFNFANITTAESTLQQQQKEMQRRSRSPSNSSLNHALKPEEDWTKISDLAERRRIQNRIAQRNYRKKLKKRLEDLEKRADSSPPSEADSPPHLSPRMPHLDEKEDYRSQSRGQLSPDLFFDNAIAMQSRQLSQSSHSSFSDMGSPPLSQATFAEYPQQYLPLPTINDTGMYTDPNMSWYDVYPTWSNFPDPNVASSDPLLHYNTAAAQSHPAPLGMYYQTPPSIPSTGGPRPQHHHQSNKDHSSYDDVSLLPDMRDRYLQLMSAGHLDDDEFFTTMNDSLAVSMDKWTNLDCYQGNMFAQAFDGMGLFEECDASSTSSGSDTLMSDHLDDPFGR